MKNKLLLAAALCLPLVAQAAPPATEKSPISNEEAIQRLTYARQAITLDPPRDALFNSPLASHPMFNQVFASLEEAKLNDAAAMLMAETFTGAELKALVAFQNSPEGKQIRLKLPAYQKLLGATLQNYLTVAFQQMASKQGGASNLPMGRSPSGTLPPMVVPESVPVQPAATPAAPSGAGTPLKK